MSQGKHPDYKIEHLVNRKQFSALLGRFGRIRQGVGIKKREAGSFGGLKSSTNSRLSQRLRWGFGFEIVHVRSGQLSWRLTSNKLMSRSECRFTAPRRAFSENWSIQWNFNMRIIYFLPLFVRFEIVKSVTYIFVRRTLVDAANNYSRKSSSPLVAFLIRLSITYWNAVIWSG